MSSKSSINNNISNNSINNNNISSTSRTANNKSSVSESVISRLNTTLGLSTTQQPTITPAVNNASKTKNPGTTISISNIRATIENNAASGMDTIAKIRLDNYILVLGVTAAFVILALLYFLSKSFNVGRSIKKIKMYPRYQKITSAKPPGDTKLYQLQIASAYNAAHSGNQMLGYTSEHITRQLLRSGVRYLEFTIFPSTFGSDAIPVIGCGYAQGQWNITLNKTTFEAVIRVIAQNAWTQASSDESGVPAPNDPLIIGLNLATNSNMHCLDRMAEIILDYLYDHILPPKYAYQHNGQDFGSIPFSTLRRRVVIISSNGYQGSKLEELINAQWYDYAATGIHTLDLSSNAVNNVSRQDTQDLDAVLEKASKFKIWRIPAMVLERPWFSDIAIQKHNDTGGLTIVVPHVEGDFFTNNYDPQPWWNMGCQIVALNWQYIDEHMDSYVTHFSRHSFILHQK